MSKATLSQQAYDTLKQALLRNQFQSGQKLSIAALKKQYGIGTSPLREALTRLVANGLLECEQMKGFKVPTISLQEIDDAYHARMLIEVDMLKLAVEHITDEQEGDLVAALHQLRKIEDHPMDEGNFCQWASRHRVFIQALVAGCQSPTLIRLQKQLYDQTERYRRTWFDWSSSKGHVSLAEHAKDHQAFVDALIHRDAERLCATYQSKLTRWFNEMRQCLQEIQQ